MQSKPSSANTDSNLDGNANGEVNDSLGGKPVRRTGLRRLVYALRYSLSGIAAGWRHEAAFRQVSVIAAVLVPAALLLDVTRVEKAALIAVAILPVIVESLNSALEATVDRISLAAHPLSKRAKDLGSAAQLFALIALVLVWLVILL